MVLKGSFRVARMVIHGRGTCVVMSTKTQSSPSPAQPRATQRSSRTAQPSPALPTATQPSMVVSAKAQINSLLGANLAQLCPPLPSPAQPSPAVPSPAKSSPAPAQPSLAQRNPAQPNPAFWGPYLTIYHGLQVLWFVPWLSEPGACVLRASGFVHCLSEPGACVLRASGSFPG